MEVEMSPRDSSSDLDGKPYSDSSTVSSDSESFFEQDVRKCTSLIKNQWEAVERTLYQEPGEEINDAELLRECKIWRESFPHYRIRGTKIGKPDVKNVKEKQNEVDQINKHFDINKLNEKRASIKKKVVGELVDRLISKFNSNKEILNVPDTIKETFPRGVQITELPDSPKKKPAPKKSILKPAVNYVQKESVSTITNEDAASSEKESYFERGKLMKTLEDLKLNELENQKRDLHEDFKLDESKYLKLNESDSSSDELRESMHNKYSWESEISPHKKYPTARSDKQFGYLSRMNPISPKLGVKKPKKPKPLLVRPDKFTPPSELLSGIIKPTEINTKLSKKYEKMLADILTRTKNDGYINASSPGVLDSPREKYIKGRDLSARNKNLPKINKFENNWLDRIDMNSCYYDREEDFRLSNTKSSINPFDSWHLNKEPLEQFVSDEKYIDEIKREILSKCKRPPKNPGAIENISLTRPKLVFNKPMETKKTQKSSSCGDLMRKNCKTTAGRNSDLNARRSGSNVKTRAKSTSVTNHKSNLSGRSTILPPIESGIVCIELTGRPKVGSKKPTAKRY